MNFYKFLDNEKVSFPVKEIFSNNDEKISLLAEKTCLERMIKRLPEKNIIDIMSLEARKQEIEEELKKF